MALRVRIANNPSKRVSISGSRAQQVKLSGFVNGSTTTLEQLSDVDASDPDVNEVLVYDPDTQTYVIKTIPKISGGTF